MARIPIAIAQVASNVFVEVKHIQLSEVLEKECICLMSSTFQSKLSIHSKYTYSSDPDGSYNTW